MTVSRASGGSLAAIDDPAQHPQIVAETRPQIFAGSVLAEPVDVKNRGRRFELGPHVDPMSPIVAEVVTGEGLHRHGVATHDADGARGRRGRLGGDARADQHTVPPAAGLKDERRQGAAPAAEHDGGNRHAARRVRELRIRRVLPRVDREARVRMCGRAVRAIVRPALPIQGGPTLGESLPPGLVVLGHGHVGENGVAPDGVVGVAVGLGIGARNHAEVAGLGIDRVEPAVLAGMQPGDVFSECPDLPALVGRRRYQHGEIGFAAGRREGAGEIVGLALRIFDPHDEHVLGEPALGAGLPARNAQAWHFLPSSALPP